MLQQTQISRVLPKYEEWLKEFPTIRRLASAPFPKVLRAWRGLGYNRRARFLKDAAEAIVRQYQGVIPRDKGALRKLPGIGSYTAGAIACFAYGKCEPFLDTNIRRVYLYFFKPRSTRHVGDKELIELVRRNSPQRPGRDWYYALMDYGREELGKKRENPNRLWRGYAKQSAFIGSRRYVRAKIVALLLQNPKGKSAGQLRTILAQEHPIQPWMEPARFADILTSLEKDRLIFCQDGKWRIYR